VAGSSSSPEDLEPGGAGSLRWQRARLVLDQHQRGVDAGPVGQVLPVHAGLADLLPHRGLRRGSTVVVRGSTTVLLALLAEATAEGSWAAVVGMPDLGLLAAAELGVAISRLALVPRPGAEFGAVVSALLDGLDLVAVAATGSLTTKDDNTKTRSLTTVARRLSARARHRESVLVAFGSWPGADLELNCTESSWSGLGDGHGHLVERELTVTVQGRGAAARPASARVLLPAAPEPPTYHATPGAPSRLAYASPPINRSQPRQPTQPAGPGTPDRAGAPGPRRWLPGDTESTSRPQFPDRPEFTDRPELIDRPQSTDRPTHLSVVPGEDDHHENHRRALVEAG
jgi:hypothetical protein